MGNRVEPQELPLRRRDFGSVLISRSQGTLPASCSISSTIGQARSRTSHDEIVPSSRPKSRKIFINQGNQYNQGEPSTHLIFLKYVELSLIMLNDLDMIWLTSYPVSRILLFWSKVPRGKESKYCWTCNRPDGSEPERLGTQIRSDSHVLIRTCHQIIQIMCELGSWLYHSWIDLRSAEHHIGTIVGVLWYLVVSVWSGEGLRNVSRFALQNQAR